ncbi:MAG TPA: hypothetical protein VIN10_02010 [Bacteroidales bacterium]
MKINLSKAAILMAIFFVFGIQSTNAKKDEKAKSDTLKSSVFSGLKWRSIGPALVSGRISDFAVNPENHAIYFVAAASGHIWKTENNGGTFSPVFDNYGAYSIGALAMDPNNYNVVWAGTGENNHQRALGYGNGVYKTIDGGESWTNMGLKESRQIGEILIDPRNSNVVYVAAEGSAWGPGGERGVYKTTDGGKTWECVLTISENTGVANLSFEPGNPDVIYAGAEQRRRTQFGKIGGGPESAFYKTTDAGKNWEKLTNGIPGDDKGGMEIVVSPADPNIVYAMFEATENGGTYRSDNRGASFTKVSDHFSSGQYYSELICDPKNPYKLYSVETVTQVSEDGGKTWRALGNKDRHVDDHAMWINPEHTDHFFIGGDGGVYESYDAAKTFIFKTTLPVTQFYRLNVDDTEPFYWIYGGTQDNNSIGGPTRNTRRGVSSSEWIVTLGGDGFWQAIDPNNPDIIYSAYQYGNIYRYDKKSGERMLIKPEPNKDELTFRWNWDAPFFLSPHSSTRLYMAANKVFRSDDMGNSWVAISGDITRNEDRNQFKVMGKYWPADAVAKDVSTSQWGSVVALAESPITAGLIFAGTDDGLIQVTEDDGKTWTKIAKFPGVPDYTYVSDVTPSSHDANVVFASLNNTKSDDFKPYLLKSSDKGKTWTSIAANLPENGAVHSIVQDPVNKDLLFVGTEFSFYFSIDGGKIWVKFANGLPDVAVRDIAIQQRENDLAIATFGRGFYILDDYSALRTFVADTVKNPEAVLFNTRDAWMYMIEDNQPERGSAVYVAPNPEFGATFTYYVKEIPKSLKSIRLKKEAELFKNGEPIPQPTKEILDAEKAETGPYFVFTIKNEEGNVVRKLYSNASEGVNRITWDLRYKGAGAVRLSDNKFDPTSNGGSSFLALPGEYTVELNLYHNGTEKLLAGPGKFTAKALNNTTLPAENRQAMVDFYKQVAHVWSVMDGISEYHDELNKQTSYIQQALQQNNQATLEMKNQAYKVKQQLEKVDFTMNGTPAKASWEEVPPEIMPLNNRLSQILEAAWESTSAPTANQKKCYDILMQDLPGVLTQLNDISNEIQQLNAQLDVIKADYTPGRIPKL